MTDFRTTTKWLPKTEGEFTEAIIGVGSKPAALISEAKDHLRMASRCLSRVAENINSLPESSKYEKMSQIISEMAGSIR